MMEILRHRQVLFTTKFSKILYCLPAKHLANQTGFISELKKACPEVIVRGGDPNFNDFRGDTLPKLIGKAK
jgi:hypothetical protein